MCMICRIVALALCYKLKTFYIDQTVAVERKVILEGTSTRHWGELKVRKCKTFEF